jgi:hypothetical protein
MRWNCASWKLWWLSTNKPGRAEDRVSVKVRYPCLRCSNSADAALGREMAEVLAWFTLAGVAILLTAAVVQQFRQIGPRGHLLDRLALVPQWKFFGQDAVGRDPAWLDDWHVLARLAAKDDATPPGPWLPVLSPAVRTGWHWVWNPHSRSRAQLLIQAESLGHADRERPAEPTALAYLALLRACFEVVQPGENQLLQFAVVATRGRDQRPVFLRFLSRWHVR